MYSDLPEYYVETMEQRFDLAFPCTTVVVFEFVGRYPFERPYFATLTVEFALEPR